MTSDVSLLLVSFLAGILVGLTSMGGAAIVTPFLVLVLGVRPVLAVGTDLVYGAVTKIVGAWMHWRQGTVNMAVVRRLAMGSVPGGFTGVMLIRKLDKMGIAADDFLRPVLGVVLMVVSVVILARTFDLIPERAPAWLERNPERWTVIWGFLIGMAVGLTSVGSGSLLIPFLIMVMKGDSPSKIVGTDVFHAAILVSATAGLYVQAGNVNWEPIPHLLIGSIPGVMLGSYLAPRLPARGVRVGLGVVLFATGFKLIPI